MELTTHQQLFSLCRLFARRMLYWMLGASIASGIVVVVGAEHLHTTSLPYVMIPALFVIVALAVLMTVPYVRHAWQAVQTPQRCEDVKIEIEIDSYPDATRYYARVPATTSGAWRFEFIPQGWKPVAGALEAEARYIAEVRWPVLVLVAPTGILVPMYEPKRLAAPVSRADEERAKAPNGATL